MSAPAEAGGARRRLPVAAGAAIIALAVLAAYADGLRAPFIYDDQAAIVDNASIRNLWPPWGGPLAPPGDTTVGGRPVANLSLALNYALGGTQVVGYHALNILIHVLGALALFGVARRTFAGTALRARFGPDAAALALAVALLWSLHPLQTESVTYTAQRVESLMGLFYLLTLYCAVRSAEAARPAGWRLLAVVACALGMATKEVMVTAPVVVLLYDRTFLAGSLREAWRRRRGLYLALGATWLLLPALVASTGWNRGRSAGFDAAVPAAQYWLAQLEAVGRYAALAVWPRPLVFEYGPFRVHSFAEVLPYSAIAAALAAATALALRRRPALGFLGAWFLAILAPTCVVPVATQTMAEHRVYLSLAAAAAALVAGAYAWAGRRSWPALGALAVLLAFLTADRNRAYGSELGLWADTVAKRPDNASARNNLGLALFRAGRTEEAVREYRSALAIQPAYPGVLNNLGNALDRSGDVPGAVGCYEAALRLEPGYAAAHYGLARALDRQGRTAEAVAHYEQAVGLEPRSADARCGLGEALARSGRTAEAAGQFEAALRIRPDFARAHFGRANALARSGRIPEAIAGFEETLRLEPGLAEASNNLGILLCRTGRLAEGLGRIEAAIRAQPDFAPAHFSRGMALVQLGRRDEAAEEFARVLKLRPGDPSAERALELVRPHR